MSLFRRIFNGWKNFLRQTLTVETVIDLSDAHFLPKPIQMKKWGKTRREITFKSNAVMLSTIMVLVNHEMLEYMARQEVWWSSFWCIFLAIVLGSLKANCARWWWECSDISTAAVSPIRSHTDTDTDTNDDNDNIAHRPSSPPRARLRRLRCHRLRLYPHRRARTASLFVLSHEIHIRALTRSNMWE